MRNLLKVFGIIALVAVIVFSISACASAPKYDFADLSPSAGNAFLYVPINHQVTRIDGRNVKWKHNTRNEIAAGTRQVRIEIDSHEFKTTHTVTYEFEEGKTYSIVGSSMLPRSVRGYRISIETGPDVIELVEVIEQLQGQIKVVGYRPKDQWQYTFISYSHDGSMIVAPSGNALEIYSVADGSLVRRLTGHSEVVTSGTWNANGTRIVSGDRNGILKVWDVTTGNEILSTERVRGFALVRDLKVTPDGSKVIGRIGNTLKVWNINNGQELVSMDNVAWNTTSGNAFFVMGSPAVFMSPDGQYFSAQFTGRNNNGGIFSINGGEPVRNINFFPKAFLNNNTLLFEGTGDIKRYSSSLLNTSTGEAKWESHMRNIFQAAFTANGERLVTLHRGMGLITGYASAVSLPQSFIRIHNAETGDVISQFTVLKHDFIAMDVSPVENKIVTLSLDGTIRFWDF